MTEEIRLCLRCGDPIPAARIKALPETWLCVGCSEAVGGDFKITAIPESLGKSNSLKKNYGAVTIKKQRRSIKPLQPESQEKQKS